MDGKNVTELTEISNLNDDDAMLVGQSNSLKRISFANVKTLFWTIINVVSNLATSAKNGLMAAVDKAKLDAMSDTLKNKTVSDSVVDSSDIIVSGKAVNGALADLVNYNISTATSLDNAIPTVSQKYKKSRFRGTVNSIDGIWLIETYNTQHDSNNNLYLYTQFAYQLKTDTVIGSKFIRQGYSSDKGVTNTWATWEKLATSSDLNGTMTAITSSSSNVNIVCGGFTKIGKMVFINMRFSVTQANGIVRFNTNAPTPKPLTKQYIPCTIINIQQDVIESTFGYKSGGTNEFIVKLANANVEYALSCCYLTE